MTDKLTIKLKGKMTNHRAINLTTERIKSAKSEERNRMNVYRMTSRKYSSKFHLYKLNTVIDLVLGAIYSSKERMKKDGYLYQLVFITPIAPNRYISLAFNKLLHKHNGFRNYSYNYNYFLKPIRVKWVGVRTYFWFSFRSASERAAFVSDMEKCKRLTTGKLFFVDFDR